MDQSPYDLLAVGKFSLRNILASFDPSKRLSWTIEEMEQIEKAWNDVKSSGTKIYNGPLARLLNYKVSNNCFFLELGVTNFKEYIGTNENIRNERTETGFSQLSNPLAVSVITRTTDRKIILEIRSAKVLRESVGQLHVKPSGHMVATVQSVLEAGRLIENFPFENAVITEASEELGVQRDEVIDVYCTGLIRTIRNRKPELTFMMDARIHSNEILSRPKNHSWESDKTLCVTYEPDSLLRLLIKERGRFVPPGHAAILLAGIIDFGPEWGEKVYPKLNQSLPSAPHQPDLG